MLCFNSVAVYTETFGYLFSSDSVNVVILTRNFDVPRHNSAGLDEAH